MKRVAALAALLLAAASFAASIVPDAAVAAPSGCSTGTNGSKGYAYAGHQAAGVAHGIRASITATVKPTIANGHVAGWIGVGGPNQGPNGETMWLQTGIAGIPGLGMVVYAEITRPGADPQFVQLAGDVQPGQRFDLAVLEVAGQPGRWRVWLNGKPATAPIALAGSSNRWKPIATTESFNGGTGACNAFGFRFEHVGVAAARGGSWQTFVPGYRFLDRGFTLRQLRPVPAGQRALATDAVQPYAFEAGSATA